MSEQLDAQGEAHEALSSAVASFGPRVLSNPRILGNVVTDLLPDLPRERSLLVTAAEADVAGELSQHVEQQHLDADTAIQLVARGLSDRKMIDPAASMWVASEYAQALGYPVGSSSRSGGAAPPRVIPQDQDTITSLAGQGSPQAQTLPPQPDRGGGRYGGAGGGGYAPGGAGQPAGPAGPVWPQPQPQPVPPRRKRNGRVIAAGGTAAVVVLYLIIAAAAHIAPFTGPTPKPTPSPRPSPSPSVHSTAPVPTSTIAPLAELLPSDLDDPATQCKTYKPPFSVPAGTKALACTDPGLTNGSIFAYQMPSSAAYQQAWANFNKWWGFDSGSPGPDCPPASSSTQAEGTTTFNDKFFPTRAGQVLECEWVGTGNTLNQPAYTWTYPTENAFIQAEAAPNTTFSALNSWWTNNSAPLNSPSPAP